MDKLITKLKELEKRCPVSENFEWEMPKCDFLDMPEELNNYQKNIYLKEHLYKYMQQKGRVENLEIYYWIIKEWGGIKSFQRNREKNNEMKEFEEQLEKGNFSKVIFRKISSYSKIASFLYPEKYAIYDSRVTYSLNWLLFKYTEHSLFPRPTGRNKELAKYNLETIIRLSGQKQKYLNYDEAYFKFCELLKELSAKVYNCEKPYAIKMLLFSIAPNYIVKDIEKSVKITIQNNPDEYNCKD